MQRKLFRNKNCTSKENGKLSTEFQGWSSGVEKKSDEEEISMWGLRLDWCQGIEKHKPPEKYKLEWSLPEGETFQLACGKPGRPVADFISGQSSKHMSCLTLWLSLPREFLLWLFLRPFIISHLTSPHLQCSFNLRLSRLLKPTLIIGKCWRKHFHIIKNYLCGPGRG